MLMGKWIAAAAAVAVTPGVAIALSGPMALNVSRFAVVARESGPVNYYATLQEGSTSFVRATYLPGYKTTVLGIEVPKELRREAHKLQWRWRAVSLPQGGNECEHGKEDSAAVVYVTFKSGLRWYSLKYVWSSVGPRGVTCDSKRYPFLVQDTIVLRSGGPLNEWVSEEIDPVGDFRRHFRNGDPNGEVPDLVGVGIMSDGDQTHSVSSADYADFALGL